MTRVNLKGEWVDYDYAIDCDQSNVDSILLELQNRGITAQYLGKSKAIKLDNKVVCLTKRHLFFKYL